MVDFRIGDQVVKATGPDYAGMLHIFNGDQLHYADKREGFADD